MVIESNILLLSLLFLGISIVYTMVGMGGASFYISLLYLFGYPLSTAIPLALFSNVSASSSASFNYYRKGLINLRLAAPLSIGAIIGAALGSQLYLSERNLLLLLSLALFAVAVLMIFGNSPKNLATPSSNSAKVVMVVGSLGLGMGMLAGMLGLGGAVFAIPVLIYLLKVEPKQAAATGLLMLLFSSISGFLGHLPKGSVDLWMLLPLGLSVFLGGQIGSRIMIARLSGGAVKRFFGVILFLIALKMLFEVF